MPYTGKVRFEGMVSTLKSGIVYSDKITTVSPSHREELLSPLGSQGLDGILNLRREDFVGILNGLDTAEWDPSSDKDIAFPYNAETLEKGKHENQADLLKAFGVKWYGGPVYGMVSRLSWQKGVDLVLASGKRALSQGANLLILGNGEYELEQKCENLRKAFPDTCGIFIGYNNALAHKIYAGCDYFLMPSLFEPCGLSQMIAQRYGTLPIVRYTGGLRDTVHGYLPTSCEASDGIGFNDYNEQGLDYGFALSREVSANQKLYYEMARRAMGLDRSWKKSAHDYLKLYRTLAPGE
jgi:starch synthase